MEQILAKNKVQAVSETGYAISKTENKSLVSRFIHWCDIQEDQRFMWLGISLFGSIGGVLPLTLMLASMAFPDNFMLWMFAAVVNVPVLAVNLAAMPTKYTLPFLFFAWLSNLAIIIYSLGALLI